MDVAARDEHTKASCDGYTAEQRDPVKLVAQCQVGKEDEHGGEQAAHRGEDGAPEGEEDGEAAVKEDAHKDDQNDGEDRSEVVGQFEWFEGEHVCDWLVDDR